MIFNQPLSIVEIGILVNIVVSIVTVTFVGLTYRNTHKKKSVWDKLHVESKKTSSGGETRTIYLPGNNDTKVAFIRVATLEMSQWNCWYVQQGNDSKIIDPETGTPIQLNVDNWNAVGKWAYKKLRQKPANRHLKPEKRRFLG